MGVAFEYLAFTSLSIRSGGEIHRYRGDRLLGLVITAG
jgi:hypothetical protein